MNIKFLRGTLAQYLACTKSADTLYFITDTGALYLGEKLIGKDYDVAIKALQDAGYQNAAQVGELISTALAGYYTKGEVDNLLAGLEVGAIAGRVEAIEKDYLKAADKTELSNAINAEKERALGVESGLESRLAAVEGDYLKGADKTELEGKINGKVAIEEGKSLIADSEIERLAGLKNYDDTEVRGLIDAVEEDIAEINHAETGILAQAKAYTDGVKDAILGEGIKDTFDTLVEIQTWMEGEGVNATELSEAIAAEAKNREDADKAINAKLEGIDGTVVAAINASLEAAKKYADEGDADTIYDDTALSNRVSGVEGKLEGLGESTVKGYVDAEIAKVDAAGVNAKIGEIEGDIAALESGKVDKVEGYSLISDAEIARLANVDNYNDSAISGRIKAIEDLGLVENYALKSEVQAVDNKLVNYVEKEGYIAYTQEEKNKLAGLNNYNDTEVRGLIGGVDERLGVVEGKVDVAKVSEAIAAALAEAKKYADDNDANTVYDDTAVRGLITTLDGEIDGLVERVGVIEAKPAMGITSDNIAAWNGKATLEEVKTAFIGETSVKLIDVVAAVNKLYDGSEGVNNEIKSMNQNVKALEGALTWGEIK